MRLPWTTTESSVSGAGQFSDGQAVVAILARGLSAAMVALALVGLLTSAKRPPQPRRRDPGPAPLMPVPVGDYGGEVLFRIYLFTLPFMAFLGAHALLHPFGERPPFARDRRS